jgi:hypothetical protein
MKTEITITELRNPKNDQKKEVSVNNINNVAHDLTDLVGKKIVSVDTDMNDDVFITVE